MPKNSILDWSTTASDNTDVGGIDISEGCPAANMNNMGREIMAQVKAGVDYKAVLASKSGNYTAVVNDNNSIIRFSAAATLSLPDASTLGVNWHVTVMADGGAVTVDPNASETINGATTIVIPEGLSTLVICDGTNFYNANTTQAGATSYSLVNGSAGSPSVSFASEPNTGLLRPSAGNLQTAVQGVLVSQQTPTGTVFQQPVSGSGFTGGLSTALAATPGTYRGNLGLGAMALATQTVVDETSSIQANDNDTTIPTSAAVSDLVFGGYRGLWREEVFSGSTITAANGLSLTALASGTLSAPSTAAEQNHSRAFPGTGVVLNCSTTVNSGYRVFFSDTLILPSGGSAPMRFVTRMSFRGTALRQAKIRAGFTNGTDHVAPATGVFLDIDPIAATITPVVDGFSTVNGTPVSTVGLVDFVIRIDYDATDVKFRVYNISSTPTVFLSQDMAAPIVTSNAYWTPQVIATTPGTTAGTMVTLHSIGYGSAFPW